MAAILSLPQCVYLWHYMFLEHKYHNCGFTYCSAFPDSLVIHYNDVIMSISIQQPHDCLFNRLYRPYQRKHQNSMTLAFVRGIHRWPVNSWHKGPVIWKMFPFNDVIMITMPVTVCGVWCTLGRGFLSLITENLLMIIVIHTHGETSNGSWCIGIKG